MANDRSIPRAGEEPDPTSPKRSQPPSRARYAAANPPHTVRFTLNGYEKLAAISERMGVSFNRAVNIAVDGLDDAAIEMIHAHAHEQGLRLGIERAQAASRAAGYAQAKLAFCLSFRCPFCGQPVEIRVGDAFAHFVLQTLVASGLGHQGGCPQPSNGRVAPDSGVR
jgi:hypothetical protein